MADDDYEVDFQLNPDDLNFKLTSQNLCLQKSLKSDPKLNLLAHSSKHGLTFIVNDNKIKIFQSISTKFGVDSDAVNSGAVAQLDFVVDLEDSAHGIYLNASHTFFYVILPNKIQVFQTQNLAKVAEKSITQQIISFSASPVDIPNQPKNNFIVVSENGCLDSYHFDENALQIKILIGHPGFFSCCVHSPKGKQIVVGLNNNLEFWQFTG